MQSKKTSGIKINEVSKLAMLPLTDDQKKKFSVQLTDVLDYVYQINQLDTENTEETAHVTGQINVFREDEIVPGLSQEEALRNAPEKYNGYFKVKYVFGK